MKILKLLTLSSILIMSSINVNAQASLSSFASNEVLIFFISIIVIFIVIKAVIKNRKRIRVF